MGAEEIRWLGDSQQRSWRALVIGTTLLFDRLDDDLRRTHDISLVEYEILVRLSESPNRRMRMSLLPPLACTPLAKCPPASMNWQFSTRP